MKVEVWGRRPVTVNTDPQRRCYNGCNFSEETMWGPWRMLVPSASREDAADTIATLKRANPAHEYEIRPL